MTEKGADLAAVLEHIASKGTHGPWRGGQPMFRCLIDHQHTGGQGCTYSLDGWMDSEYWSSSIYRDKEMETEKDAEQIAGTWDYDHGGIRNQADSELIIMLRNNLPTILKALRGVRE